MKTTVKAVSPVMHGRTLLQPGEEGQFTKGDAEEMRKAGLVEIVGDAPDEENLDDVLGVKMGDDPQNKMLAETDNKGVSTRKKGA